MDKHLHIICLNVPYPVDYGGVFDLYYKLPALQNIGVKIHLHCFEYGRGEQPILNQFCESVQYYPRKTFLTSLSFTYPYIVSSRDSKELIDCLLNDDYPILMEGVHCTFLLNDIRFDNRNCFVRLHNVEHIYYRFLYQYTPSFFKKIYYKWESSLLEKYEKSIADKATFISVSENDSCIYKKMGAQHVFYLPLFLPDWKITSKEGRGCFCLYHGDLSIPENEKAVVWLMKEVFSKINTPFVAAGKNPSPALRHLIHSHTTTCLIENPSESEMKDLIAKSHINIIPSYNETGIKIKLLNALYNGRHCLVNNATIQGTDLVDCCQLAETAEDFIEAIQYIYEQPFTNEQIEIRQQLLASTFNNHANASQLIDWIWEK